MPSASSSSALEAVSGPQHPLTDNTFKRFAFQIELNQCWSCKTHFWALASRAVYSQLSDSVQSPGSCRINNTLAPTKLLFWACLFAAVWGEVCPYRLAQLSEQRLEKRQCHKRAWKQNQR